MKLFNSYALTTVSLFDIMDAFKTTESLSAILGIAINLVQAQHSFGIQGPSEVIHIFKIDWGLHRHYHWVPNLPEVVTHHIFLATFSSDSQLYGCNPVDILSPHYHREPNLFNEVSHYIFQ